MRRIALIVALLAAAAAALTSMAAAGDSHTYKIEMYNAFGMVKGSDIRIAGVNAGSVTALDITADKTALMTVETSGPLGVLGKDTKCSAEPQSLIAEYFLTCTPNGPPLDDGDTIPASQVHQSVQSDLVANTLREPFKVRLQLLINEFGTALAGNPKNLNEAIRLGAPALEQLTKALDILASESRTIRDLNANSDTIIAQLAARRADVVKFIQEARDTSAISASRRADLSADFNRLDDFLHQLHPTLTKLGDVAQQQTPLLRDLRLAAPGLNTLALKLPAFNRATQRSLESLGQAAVPGKQALNYADRHGVIRALAASGKDAYSTANTLDKFLLDLDTAKRKIAIDSRAAKTCADKTKACYASGRSAPTGYTGFEGLLNYVYYQALALNQFDSVGHLLHFSLFDVNSGPCGEYSTGHDEATGATGVPAIGGGLTTDITQAHPCVSWLGANQPGINQSVPLPPYDNSVCPNGTVPAAALSVCDPTVSLDSAKRQQATASGGAVRANQPSGGGGTGGGTNGNPLPQLPPSTLPGNPQDLPRRLRDLLGVGQNGQGALGGLGGGGAGAGQAANDLLDFLFAP